MDHDFNLKTERRLYDTTQGPGGAHKLMEHSSTRQLCHVVEGPKVVYSYVHVHNCRFFGGGVGPKWVYGNVTVVFVCFFIKKITILMKILVDERQANHIKYKIKKDRQTS